MTLPREMLMTNICMACKGVFAPQYSYTWLHSMQIPHDTCLDSHCNALKCNDECSHHLRWWLVDHTHGKYHQGLRCSVRQHDESSTLEPTTAPTAVLASCSRVVGAAAPAVPFASLSSWLGSAKAKTPSTTG